MSDEEKIYTKGEVKILVEASEIKVKQAALLKMFSDHMKEDSEHFDRLYQTDKEIIKKINLIPKNLADCSAKMERDIMMQSRREFTKETDFQVFKAKIMTGVIVGITIGSIIATVISLVISTFKIFH